jgi:hypothetical protein
MTLDEERPLCLACPLPDCNDRHPGCLLKQRRTEEAKAKAEKRKPTQRTRKTQ